MDFLGATTGTDREVVPAVGDPFVVMFEEQFESREHLRSGATTATVQGLPSDTPAF